jgi:hypothetical protein
MGWELLNVLGDGLVIIKTDRVNHQIWVRTSRKGTGKECIVCGQNLAGRLSYRPAGNPPNRGERICVRHVEEEIVKRQVVVA